MMNKAKVINIAESNPSVASTSNVPSSMYKEKLVPLIKQAKATTVTTTFKKYRKLANHKRLLNRHWFNL